jgi:hypothetical protein
VVADSFQHTADLRNVEGTMMWPSMRTCF